MYARNVPFLADHPPSIWNLLPHHLWIFFSHLGWGTRSTKYVQRFMGEEPIHRWGYSTGSRATRNHVEQDEIVQARASLQIFIQKALLINRSTKKADTFFYPEPCRLTASPFWLDRTNAPIKVPQGRVAMHVLRSSNSVVSRRTLSRPSSRLSTGDRPTQLR